MPSALSSNRSGSILTNTHLQCKGVAAVNPRSFLYCAANDHPVSKSRLSRPPGRCRAYPRSMWTLIIVLLVLWAILAIVGFVFEGLLWLAVIGAVLFVGTLIIGIIRQRARRSSA